MGSLIGLTSAIYLGVIPSTIRKIQNKTIYGIINLNMIPPHILKIKIWGNSLCFVF